MADNRKCFQTHLSAHNCRFYTSISIYVCMFVCNPVEQARCALNSAGSAATQFLSYTHPYTSVFIYIHGDKSVHIQWTRWIHLKKFISILLVTCARHFIADCMFIFKYFVILGRHTLNGSFKMPQLWWEIVVVEIIKSGPNT